MFLATGAGQLTTALPAPVITAAANRPALSLLPLRANLTGRVAGAVGTPLACSAIYLPYFKPPYPCRGDARVRGWCWYP